jgi:prophage maintenance system killer protein
MRFILSRQSLVYLYDKFRQMSQADAQPFATQLTEEQLDRLYGIIKGASTGFFGKVPFRDVLSKVAFVINGINRNHVLIDGNKRFSMIVALYLLDINHITHSKISQNDWEMLIMRVATDSKFTVRRIREYLKEKITQD